MREFTHPKPPPQGRGLFNAFLKREFMDIFASLNMTNSRPKFTSL